MRSIRLKFYTRTWECNGRFSRTAVERFLQQGLAPMCSRPLVCLFYSFPFLFSVKQYDGWIVPNIFILGGDISCHGCFCRHFRRIRHFVYKFLHFCNLLYKQTQKDHSLIHTSGVISTFISLNLRRYCPQELLSN